MPSYDRGGFNTQMNGYIDPSDVGARNLKQRKDDFYLANYTCGSRFMMEGAIDKRFKVGDQSMYSYGNQSINQNSYRYFFNLIRRHINMTCGYQRKNRKSTIVIPIHDDDDPLADDFNAVMRWCEDRDGFQEYLSESFEGAVDVGENLLYMYPDYTLDAVSGDLFTDSVGYNNYLIDQYYRKQDLSDCNGIYRRRWVSKEMAKSLLKGYDKEIDKMNPSGMKDGRFPLQAELNNVALNKLFTYDEFHYRTTREATMIIDPYTSESVEWEQDVDDQEDMMERTLAQQPWLQVKKMQIPTVKLCVSLGDKTVYDGPNLLNIDLYPCVPSTCYYEPDVQNPAWRKMGMIRNMRDAQFLYNMRKVIELEILQSQINSGWIFPTDAVTDVKAFRQTGQGFLIPLKAGHLPAEIQRIEAAAIPQSLMELSASLSEDITKISGVNEELLGSATDDKSGILSMLRQGAGLTTLQTIFDKLDYTQRLYGKIRLQAIRKKFSKGKIRNILGHDPDERFFTSHSQKYGLAVEEGNYSTSQRQMELQQLLHFKELGMGIPDKSILRAAFITNKRQIEQDMEEVNQQQQQAQQAESESKMKVENAKVMNMFSKSKLDMAKVAESEANAQKLLSMADHETMEADYALVETAMRLEDVQFNQIKNAIELAQGMKMAQLEHQAMAQQNQMAMQPQQIEQ